MEDKYNIKQMIIFILIIVITLGIFYGITILVTKNKKTTTDDAPSTSILVILGTMTGSGRSFSMQPDSDVASTINNANTLFILLRL